MAQNYRCDICEQVAADFMVTDIRDGEVTAIGIECLLEWALPLAEAFAQAQARETGDPDTVRVTDTDPQEPAATEAAEALQGAQEPSEVTDEEWEASAQVRGGRGRKRGSPGEAQTEREDTQAAEAADVNG